ncbi:Dabb family protein [Hymenobacter sp. HSC-4F20]|uniref:Dabb family protein n=1 Tax=Hymenobacter sp. HSC-4F20 TaxID=2864135 RepID=UPI001C72A0B7|nr:Dabb family protein [Hymenobacter sp. HSC-4F20]MBX0293035.1 Dabb family protein [Hymenobacter sp. HSC-4F20]
MSAPFSPECFVHHVLFYTPANASAEEKARLLEGLTMLKTIPSIKLAHIGTPAQTTRDVIERTYTYSWLCFFDSAEEEERYQRHPTHDEFRNAYASCWEKVVIYDSIGLKEEK